MKKLLSNLVYTIAILSFVWGVMSYVEIVCKNTNPNPTYSEYNLIVNLTTYAAERIEY